ncbi:hypothetical protein M1293_00615 [Candidatus Parvarchaeota archaeon]|nr:hypothetical protein [Candidatus Parvarchaeota archaeon]
MKTKAQSALEYMMTYGWAILIIVIVAAVLYSLGIFSPSSSVGAVQTGFAPFTATASSCTPGYFAVAFSTGGLPAGSSDATITAATTEITSDTGLPATTLPAQATGLPAATTITVTPGSTFVVNWSSVKCSTPGVHYSASITMNYTYTSAGLTSVVPAKGTVSGTSS